MHQSTKPKFSSPSPGEVLRRYIVRGDRIKQDELALAMKVSRVTINQLINDKRAITAEMALRLARVLNTTPEFWLDLQRGVDLHKARLALASDIKTMPVLRSAVV